MSALKGIFVVDLCRVRAGPVAVRQLADWGAEVVRIEAPVGLDADESLGGPEFDNQNVQRNKRSLTLNLKEPEGIAILSELVRRADVLVENFRPDVKHRLGVDYESLRKLNPRLIYGSVSGFGQTGPYALRPGFDQIAQGMGGLMSITGEPDGSPMRAGIAIADVSAGLYCALGILLALYERERSGQGQWVHSSLLEAQIALLDFQAARWLVAREVPGRVGNNHPTVAPMGVYPTKQGELNLGVGGERIWRRFCETLGAEELLRDPRFTLTADRVRHRAELGQALQNYLERHTAAEWVEILNAAGVPCGPIHDVQQVFADPQVQHLGIAQPVHHPRLGDIELVGQPVHLSRTDSAITRPAPDKGQHTREILLEMGYSQAQIADLQSRHIV